MMTTRTLYELTSLKLIGDINDIVHLYGTLPGIYIYIYDVRACLGFIYQVIVAAAYAPCCTEILTGMLEADIYL